MKLTILIITIACVHVSAKVFSQINLTARNIPLAAAINTIENQSGYSFFYKESLIHNITVSPVLHNATLQQALDQLLHNQQLEYAITNGMVIIKKKEAAVAAEVKVIAADPVTVSGVITDSLGIPFNRATIFFIKRIHSKTAPLSGKQPHSMIENIRFLTSENGTFNLNAEEGDEIGISYVGYQVYKFTVVKNMKFLNVVLHSVEAQLDEVVVHTGYQTLSKERATGSFSKPDMKIFANANDRMDIIGRLDGLIPGLTVGQTASINTVTKAKAYTALVRGSSSVQLATNPLYVVNGVIVTDFNLVNTDDVEDITVLKDAAAAAIWGAQAANGVIVVTTKSGARNQKVKISYQSFVNFQGKPNLNYQRYLNSAQYIQAAREVFNPVAFPYSTLTSSFIAPHEQILYNQNSGAITAAQANKSLDSLAGINNRQQILDLLYQNAFVTNHTVSASGGSKTYNFYSSLGYTDNQSSTIGEKNNTYRINVNQSFTPNDRFSFSLSTSLTDIITSGKHPVLVSSDALPYQLYRDANGNNINMPYVSGMSPAQRASYSAASGIDLNTYIPLDELNYGHSNGNNLSINLVQNTSVKLWKGLSFQGTYGYTTSPGTSTSYDDHKQYSMRQQLVGLTMPGVNGSAPTYLIPATGGNFTETNANERSWTVRNQLVYTYSGRDGKDELNLQGGQEARERSNQSDVMSVAGYNEDLRTSPQLNYATLSQGVPGTVTGYGFYNNQAYRVDGSMSRYTSYFALASYTLDHKYSADASWRVDHSNLFGSDVSAQNKPVYSFGAKWNATNEDFLKPVTWLNNLALRATYGITGNSPSAGNSNSFDVLYSTGISSQNIAGASYAIDSYANRNLNWESTHTTNIGMDFGILRSRLTGTVEYYHKNTTDLLGGAPVDPFTGQTSATSNLGKLVNNGFNISLNSVNIITKNFEWSSGLVFGSNSNKLVSYSAPSSTDNIASVRLSASRLIGYGLSPLFAYRYAGLNATGDPQIYLANGTVTKLPNKATAADLVYKGSLIPNITGGINNRFRYKQFELSANMVYSFGAVMRRDVNLFYGGRLTGQGFGGDVSSDFADRWKKPGDENTTDIPSYNPSNSYNSSSRNITYYTKADINVVSASYLKLRQAALAYSFPASLSRLLKVESIRVNMQVSNILLWKANKYGIDPEYQSFQSGTRGVPTGQHAISMGLNVNF